MSNKRSIKISTSLSVFDKMKYIRIIILTLIVSVNAYAQDTLRMVGLSEFSFYGGITHKMDVEQRNKIESSFDELSEIQTSIIEFIKASNDGDYNLSQKILKEELDNQNEFGLLLGFMFFQMKQLGVLYSPAFLVVSPEGSVINNKEPILISCTIEQYEQLKLSSTQNEFICVYIGELYVDKIKVYRLIEVKSIE